MRRRRRLLYLVGLVPSLLLIGLSGRIAVLLYEEDRAMSAYTAGDHERAREGFAANRVLNPIERWVAPFGEGTARFRLEDYPGAIKDLEAALVRVPDEHECIVRVNLALSHEALGDSVVEDDQAEAAEAWQEARDVLQPCKELAEAEAIEAELREEQERDERDRDREDREDREDPTTEELEERSRAAAVRLDQRLARKLGEEEPPDTRRPDEAPPEDEMTREQRERLREKNKKALEENVEHKDDFDFDPPSESPSPAEPSPTPNW